MKKAIILLMLLMIPLVSAIDIVTTTFNDSTTTGNMTFLGDDNITFYLSFPMFASANNLNISLNNPFSTNLTPDYYWPFENGNTTDIVQDYNIVRFGNTSYPSTGSEPQAYRNTSLVFDDIETDYGMTFDAQFISAQTFSISLWVYRNAGNVGANSIINQGGATSIPFWNIGINAAGNPYYNRNDGTDFFCTGTEVIPNEKWTHILWNRQAGSYTRIYVNGSLDASCHGGTLGDVPGGITYIGNDNDSAIFGNTENVTIDEMFVTMGSPLEVDQITALYQTTKEVLNATYLWERPQNIYLEIADTNEIREFNFTGPYNTSSTIGINITTINNILSNQCTCESCTISGTDCVVPFIFHSDNLGQIEYSGLTINQSWGVDSCTQFTTHSLNISFKDLDTDAGVNVDYQNTVDFSVGTNTGNFSVSETNINETSLCISPSWAEVSANILIEYENDTTIFEYSTSNTSLNNETSLLNLYLVGGTDQVILTVKDLFGDPVAGAFIKILKYDVGTGTYRTTEILETDGDGQTIANIILIDAFYRFIIDVEGETKLIEPETGGVRVLSTTKNFVINLEGADWFDQLDTSFGASTSLSFTNVTNSFVYTWNDPTSAMHMGCLKVVKRNKSGETTLNDTCVTSASSSIVMPISGIQNGSEFIATGYFLFDDEYVTDTLSQAYEDVFSFIKTGQEDEVLFFGTVLMGGMTLIGIPFPALALGLLVLSLIFTFTIGFYKISLGIILAIIVLIVIQFYKQRT